MARISGLRIEGYRSIGEPIEIAFPENQPVVLVGENNAGKSNIVKALQLVLGPFWPGSYEPEDHEFFARDRSRKIKIEIEFNRTEPLGNRFCQLIWKYSESEQEPVYFRGIDLDGRERFVRNEDRDSCMCIVVEAERSLNYHLSYASKWTLLSRLMHRFHDSLSRAAGVKADLERLFHQVKNKLHEITQFRTFVEGL